VKFCYYLNDIQLCSFLCGSWILFHPLRGKVCHGSCPQNSKKCQHHDVEFYGLCRQMPWWTMVVIYSGQWWIGHLSIYVHQVYIIWFVNSHLLGCGVSWNWLHATSKSCCFRYYVPCLNLHPLSHVQWLHWQHHGELLVSVWLLFSVGGELNEPPVIWLISDPFPPCIGVSGSRTCCRGEGEVDDNKTIRDVLRNL